VIKLGELVMILDLHRQGLSGFAIARQLGVQKATGLARPYRARLSRPPGNRLSKCRASRAPADVKPNRKRVFDGSPQDGAYERIAFAGERQTDGVQADHGGVENLAAIERRKPVAESH
jgi:hypothetical protein